MLIDNTLWSGKVLETADADDANTLALQALNDVIATDDRFTVAMLTIGDGVTMLDKR